MIKDGQARTPAERLRVRQSERDQLLRRIRGALEQDGRISAAWLEGSSARGTTDGLSDLDLTVVVPDQAMITVAGGPARPVDHRNVLDSPRGRWVTKIAEPLLLLEAPQNAPAHGAFLTSFFAGEFGPQQVDWTWLSLSTARRPPQAALLFDRADLPRDDDQSEAGGPGPAPDRTPFEVAAHAVPWFWATLIWNAKHAARHGAGIPMPMLRSTVGALRDVEGFLDQEPPAMSSDGDELGQLSELADRMDRWRVRTPDFFPGIGAELARQTRTFLRLARDLSR